MKNFKLTYVLLALSLLTIVSQNAYLSSTGNSSVLDEYRGYEVFYGNDNLEKIMNQRSTINVDPLFISVLHTYMQSCKILMDYTGKRLTEVEYIDPQLVRELTKYERYNC
jgi:hypothetical protein